MYASLTLFHQYFNYYCLRLTSQMPNGMLTGMRSSMNFVDWKGGETTAARRHARADVMWRGRSSIDAKTAMTCSFTALLV
jgi:hypothetical protein